MEKSRSLLSVVSDLCRKPPKENTTPCDPCHTPTTRTTGARIRDQRLMCGLNQMQLAEMVGVTRLVVAAWEKDEAIPGGCALDQLAADLECDPHWLLTGDGRPVPAVNNQALLDETIGARIQLARESLGLTEADIARTLGIYSGHISDWECGITEPPASMIIPLATALKCNPLWLLSGDVIHQSPATPDHQSRYHYPEPPQSDASDHASHHAKSQ